MENLSVTSRKKYYFVKDGIIFNILTSYNGLDSCAIPAGGDATVKTPSITATTNKGDETVYYLEVLIEDGDTYSEDDGFKKTIHGSEETNSVFDLYYKDLCEKEIKKKILANKSKTYDWFNDNKGRLGVPLFMLKTTVEKDGIEYTTVGSDTAEGLQIDFTEEYFNTAKEDAIRDEITNCANSTANEFGYKVSDLTFDITKKTE